MLERKMLVSATLVFAFATALAAPAFGQSFVGEWTATATTPGGAVSETVKVVKTADGYEITAKLVDAVADGTPEAGPGTEIVLDGDRFSYKRTLGELVITYSGVVSGDTFTGTVDLGGFAQAPYTGVRRSGRRLGVADDRVRLRRDHERRTVRDDHDRDRRGRFGRARTLHDGVECARRLEETAAGVDFLNRLPFDSQSRLALGDIDVHGAWMTMRR